MNILKIFKKKESQKEEISASSAISNQSFSEETKKRNYERTKARTNKSNS